MPLAQAPAFPGGFRIAVLLLVIVVTGLVFVITRALIRIVDDSDR